MASTVTIDLRHVARGLNVTLHQVQATVELLDEGNTVPFITRYRKDRTGGLDEEQIREIQSRLAKMRLLADRKQTILRSIESQGKLTEKLAKQILSATTTKRLEDLYLPFKPKKQTLATLAHSRGLEDLAREILEAAPLAANLDARSADFVNPDRQIPTAADALLGAGHILAEQFSEQAELRQRLREVLQRTGVLVSSKILVESKAPLDGTAAAESAAKPTTPAAPALESSDQSSAEARTDSPPEPVTPEQLAELLTEVAIEAATTAAPPNPPEPTPSLSSDSQSATEAAAESPVAATIEPTVSATSAAIAAPDAAPATLEHAPEAASASVPQQAALSAAASASSLGRRPNWHSSRNAN